MSLFSHRIFLAVSLAHLTVDVFSNMGPVLVTFFSRPMDLSATRIGLAIGAYQFIASLTQPFFGWLSDRIGSRWLGTVSVPWTVGCMALAVFVAQTSNNFGLFMIPFSLAAVGSGAFHPQGTVHAGTAVISRAATATAIFFLFGQAGLASGPMLAGLILDTLGPAGIYGAAMLSIPILLFIAASMRQVATPAANPHVGLTTARLTRTESIRWGALALLALLVGLRSWAFLGTASFLPKIFQNMGWAAFSYGSITGIYWLTSGISGVLAGNLGASHSIIVVIAQNLLPGRKAFASGVTLGYMFGVGAAAVWGIGALADGWGLTPVIQAGAVIGIMAALLAVVLPATRAAVEGQPEGAAV